MKELPGMISDALVKHDIKPEWFELEITESIIAMSKKVGVEVIAEGVEKKEHLNILEKAGCDLAQGYYISKPLSFPDFKNYLQSYHL